MKNINIFSSGIPIGNISVIEHPHDGLMCSFIGYGEETVLSLVHFSKKSGKWTRPWAILEPGKKAGMTHTLFLDLKGYLIVIYEIEHEIFRMESHNYGKDWSQPIRIFGEDTFWRLKNPPIFMQDGRIVLPLYDFAFNRGLSLISNDDGRNWFPSTYIEAEEDNGIDVNGLEDGKDGENASLKGQNGIESDFFRVYAEKRVCFPAFVHQSETKVGAFSWMKKSNHVHYSESDLGEIWSETKPIELPPFNGQMDCIRIKNADGDYIPDIIIVFAENGNNPDEIKLAVSDDNGENWGKIRTLTVVKTAKGEKTEKGQTIEKVENSEKEEAKDKGSITEITIFQTSDSRIQVIFTLDDRKLDHFNFALDGFLLT